MHAHTYTYTRTHTHANTHTYTWPHAHTHKKTATHTHPQIYHCTVYIKECDARELLSATHTYTHTNTATCTHMHAHIYHCEYIYKGVRCARTGVSRKAEASTRHLRRAVQQKTKKRYILYEKKNSDARVISCASDMMPK